MLTMIVLVFLFSDQQNIEANLTDHEEMNNTMEIESFPITQPKNYRRWLRISIYVFFVLSCQALSTILGRLYFENGGKSTWMGTLVQLIGFPVLFLFRFLSKTKTPKSTDISLRKFPSFITLGSVYIVTGLLVSANSYMSSVGLLYLPVSTFSLILASQLAFTAFFSYFLNSQKFTPFIVNSLFLLTISSALLVVNTDESQSTTNVSSRVKYVIGIICTIGASAGIGLLLSLVQLILRKVLKNHTVSTVMDLVAYQSLVASCVVLIGLFASGEWKTLTSEMENYKLGKAPYAITLASIAISWQVYTIGVVGLIFESSSVFSNSITAVGLPIVPVVAVIVFGDKMNTSKIFSIILAIWGFISFVYQHYLDEKKLKLSHTDHVGGPPLPVDEGRTNIQIV
ncbi:probable purine permease 8 [Brassica napus]|uniref:probable purine permease 8 n=1 Tax=Brassica napus TaxID=3708 RepID=UPI00207913C6|nr:probable purine permease 8 [Brassica napus]